MKKPFTYPLIVVLFTLCLSTPVIHASDPPEAAWLDTSNLDKGIIGILYHIPDDTAFKLVISHSTKAYLYDLTPTAIRKTEMEYFPLQLGNGKYEISLMRNTSENKYKRVGQHTVNLHLQDANVVYLNAIQNINWLQSERLPDVIETLVKEKMTDEKKVKSIYEYMIHEIHYDFEFADTDIPSTYLPNVDVTLETQKGICYDFASLFAAILRSLDIPTKLIIGTSQYVDVEHAWNEVLLHGEWVVIDPTVDSGLLKAKEKEKMIKDPSKYKTELFF